MATHRYALSAGHRNSKKGGASKGPEIAWTYPMTVMIKDEIIRRGGKAFIVQEEDGDADPTFTYRGLGETARLAENLAISQGGVDAYLSFHYGAEPIDGAFNIYPDATGLRASLRQSPLHAVDVRSNNTLDIRLARVIASHVAKTGMPLRGGGDGTLSETKSGVGLDGWRLGELEGTVGIRATTARLILEAGNSLSPYEFDLLWRDDWQNKYANAVVDGLEEVFGKFNGSITAPSPKPEVDPNAGVKRTFTLRFDVYARKSPGFYDYENNEDNRIVVGGSPLVLKPGVTGEIIEGPKVADGVEWYNVRVVGQGLDSTGWLQDQVLHTLEIKQEAV